MLTPPKPQTAIWALCLSLLTALAGCTWIPPGAFSGKQTHNPPPIQQVAQTTPFRTSALPAPEILSFPLLVPLQPMTPVTSLPKAKSLEVLLSTDPKTVHKDGILVPALGQFRIVFQVGSQRQLKVSDADARDGQALVLLPAGQYEGYVGAHVTGGSKLTVENRLYYQKQEILANGIPPIAQNGQKPPLQVYQMGTRALPTPANWYSPEGPDLVLHFTNQNSQSASIRWYESTNPVPLPLGMQEIGPAGGTVELPHVARLEIPAGAIAAPTMVKISQMLEVESNKLRCSVSGDYPPGTCILDGYDFITPVVRLEPFGLKLNAPADLYLPTDAARVGNNAFEFIKHTASVSAKQEEWYSSPFLAPLSFVEGQAGIQEKVKVKQFVYVAKQFPTDVTPTQGATSSLQRIQINSGFRIQQQTPTSEIIFHYDNKSGGSDAEIRSILKTAFEHYLSLGLKPPVAWDSFTKRGEIVIPIIIKEQPRSENVNGEQVPVYGEAKPEWSRTLLGPVINDGKYLGSTLTLSRCQHDDPTKCDTVKTLETVAHELFHLFQQSYYLDPENQVQHLNQGHYLDNFGSQDRWLAESTASYMGASFVVNQRNLSVANKNDLSYLRYLFETQGEPREPEYPIPIVLPNSLHLQPNPYHAVGFFTHQALTQGGDQKIASVVAAYGNQLKQPDNTLPSYTTRGLYALNSVVADLPNAYSNYASDAFQKQNLNFVGEHIQLPTLPINREITVNASHIQSSPLPFDTTINNLGTQIIRIKANPVIPGTKLLVKFKNQINGTYLSPAQIPIPGESGVLQASPYFIPRAFPQSAQGHILSNDILSASGITLDNFGSETGTQSLTLVISNTLNKFKAQTPIKGHFEAYLIPPPPKEALLPIAEGCFSPHCFGATEASVNLTWPADPYPYAFPGRITSGKSMTLGTLEFPNNGRPYTYALNSFTKGVDAEQKPIVTRLLLTFILSLSGTETPLTTSFSSALQGEIWMNSTDGKVFKIDTSVSPKAANMSYDYAYTASELLEPYRPSRCNPSVTGYSSALMQVTGGTLTLNEPVSGTVGSAQFSVNLSGPLKANTNGAYYCYASMQQEDGSIIYYGHKSDVTGTGSASVSMNVAVPFEKVTY